ncbi:MAG TPA: hypothetical protein VMJ10_18385 [Kofleriaceae bacterium]|nr:hypothetical protein [Kofleriaceae bacterium]
MIIFASLGLLFGLLGLAGNSAGEGLKEIPEFKTFQTMSMISTLIGLVISVIHLLAGVAAVRYKANAPSLAKLYGTANIVVTIGWAIVVFAWLKPGIEKAAGAGAAAFMGGMLIFGTILSIAWPVIVLALMSRPAAKAACTN